MNSFVHVLSSCVEGNRIELWLELFISGDCEYATHICFCCDYFDHHHYHHHHHNYNYHHYYR